MIISLVAAASENNVIGLNNKLPWYLPKDSKFFTELTWNHSTIMGRKTFESLDKPLENRRNIVITRQENYSPSGAEVVRSLDKALELCKGEEEVFIVGGAEIFRQGIEIADRIYLTRIHGVFEGDAFFPEIDEKYWKLEKKEEFKKDQENKFDFDFLVYERIN